MKNDLHTGREVPLQLHCNRRRRARDLRLGFDMSPLSNPLMFGHSWASMIQVRKPAGELRRAVPPLLVLDQPLGNDQEIVGQHGGAHQEFKMLPSLSQAPLHPTTAEEHRDAPLDAGPKTLSLPEGRAFFLGCSFGRLLSAPLGDAGQTDANLLGDLDIPFTVETAIGTVEVGRMAEGFPVTLKRRFHVILIGRVSLQDSILRDQPARTLGQKDFVSELDWLVDLAPLDPIGVRFKNRVHLLLAGNLLPLQDPTSRLIDHLAAQLAVVFDLDTKGPKGCLLPPVQAPDLPGFFQHLARLGHDLPGDADQLLVFEDLLPVSLLRRHPLNLLHAAARRAGPVGKATHPPGQPGVHSPEESSNDPNDVPQQPAIGGMVDVGFDHRGVDPQFLTVLQAQGHRGSDQSFVDGFQGPGGQPVKRAVEGVMLGDGLRKKMGKAPQRIPVGDTLAQFPQIPVFHPLQRQRTQHLGGRQSTATRGGVLQTPLQIPADPFYQFLMVGEEIGDGLQEGVQLYPLLEDFQIGKTELRLGGSAHGFSL